MRGNIRIEMLSGDHFDYTDVVVKVFEGVMYVHRFTAGYGTRDEYVAAYPLTSVARWAR